MGRIDQYPECSTPDNNDWLLIETSEGTKKVKKSTLLKAVVDVLGNKDISSIGDGTVTGAVSNLNTKLGPISSASAVSGDNAFAKINNLNDALIKHSFGPAVSLTAGVTFTAPSDGYIKLLCSPNATATAWADINGIEKLLSLAAENGYGQGMGMSFSEVVLIKKGMTVKYNGTHGATCTFYPLT